MWPRIVNVLLGLWLMLSPAILDFGGSAETNNYIVGPLVVSVGVIAASQVTREMRWAMLPLGAWLVISPWLFGFGSSATISNTIVGIAAAALSLIRGAADQRYGGGWRSLLPGHRPAGE